MAKFSKAIEAANVGRKSYKFTTDKRGAIPISIVDIVDGGLEVPDNGLVNDFEYTPIPSIGGQLTYPPNATEKL